MELHIEALQAFVLLVPQRVGVVADVDLREFADQLSDLLLMEDVANAALHSI